MPTRFWSCSPSSHDIEGDRSALEEKRTKPWTNARKLPLHWLIQPCPQARFISSQTFLKNQRNCSFLQPCLKYKVWSRVFVPDDAICTFFPFQYVQKQNGSRRLRWAEAHNEITPKSTSCFFTFCKDHRGCEQNVELLRRIKCKGSEDQTVGS